jgi:thymidylate synthase
MDKSIVMKNNLDKKYQQLLSDIIEFGVEKKDRTGTGTISEFGHQIRHKMSEGFPLITTKKMAWKQIVSELLWFLTGQTNISFLLKHNNHIWDGDAYKNYQNKMTEWFGNETQLTKEDFIEKIKTNDEFAKQWGELGPIYGAQWRNWEYKEAWENGFGVHLKETQIDQIKNLINELKTNPDSRRLMVSAWNVGVLDKMVLPPCHYGFQLYTRELSIKERLDLASKTYSVFEPSDFHRVDHKEIDELYPVPNRAISLMWNQRSVDTFLGLPFNIASYGLLLHIIAKEVNMIPDELIGNLGDTHLYLNHIQQAKEQIDREPFDLPTLKIENEVIWKEGDCLPTYSIEHFILENYQSHPTIKAPLSN